MKVRLEYLAARFPAYDLWRALGSGGDITFAQIEAIAKHLGEMGAHFKTCFRIVSAATGEVLASGAAQKEKVEK
jgi:hypothetical protein